MGFSLKKAVKKIGGVKDIVGVGTKKGNVLKNLGLKVTGDLTKPTREVARTVGARGVVNAINKDQGQLNATAGGLLDKASGKDKQLQADAEKEEARLAGIAQQNADNEQRRLAGIEDEKRETERMAVGSGSRTLLTGGMGLDDEEGSISRRMLMGY